MVYVQTFSWRLDKLLVNGECSDFFSSISIIHLVRHPSDHSPLKIATWLDYKLRPFRFLNVWTSKLELLEVIRSAWDLEMGGPPLRIVCSKLLVVRRNKQVFGNVFDAFRGAKVAVLLIEVAVESADSKEAQRKLC